MSIEEIKKLAEQIGFTYVKQVNMDALVPREDVREMCSADKCDRFGKSWSCPPASTCGTIQQANDRMHEYEGGVLCQYVAPMEDYFDLEAIRNAEEKHKSMFDTLVRQIRLMGIKNMALGSGSCTKCHKCTYPDKPCRYPDKLYPSMEAYGLWVSDVCLKSNLDYNYGDKSIAFTACILVKE